MPEPKRDARSWSRAKRERLALEAAAPPVPTMTLAFPEVDPEDGYRPGNVQRCCWPCNCTKSNKSPAVYVSEVGHLIAQYGRGKIPWRSLNPRFKRVQRLDLSEFVVDGEMMQLSLLEGTQP